MLAHRKCFAWLALLPFLVFNSQASANHHKVKLTAADGKFQVMIDADLFCEVDYSNYAKPIVYPIYGPDQVPMTRNHPMKDVDGESADHPHHKSMWFGHGLVNEVSFWHEEGTVVTEKAEIIPAADSPTGIAQIKLTNRLEGPDEKVIARETIIYSFGHSDNSRWIDWDVTLHASEGDIKLGDTKEGTAALRVHPNLRLSNDERRGVTTANGQAINSAGVTGGDIWGKRAAWVDYYGQIDGKTVGIAFLDHPENFRHPTYWHARTYGLFAANPFGLSHFVGEGEDGSHQLAKGESMRFRYRIVFHQGTADDIDPNSLFEAYKQVK